MHTIKSQLTEEPSVDDADKEQIKVYDDDQKVEKIEQITIKDKLSKDDGEKTKLPQEGDQIDTVETIDILTSSVLA